MYECLGCGKTNKLHSKVQLLVLEKILCDDCKKLFSLGFLIAENKDALRFVSKLLDRQLRVAEREKKKCLKTSPTSL